MARYAAIVHTMNVHGGVRRYFEMGNALVRAGHEFTLFARALQEKAPWMEFLGELKPFNQYPFEKFDVMFTGANECFFDLERAKADVKVIFVVAKFYASDYLKLWRRAGKKFLWVGVAKDWNLGMQEIAGATIPCGVNTNFFKPVDRTAGDRLKVAFYARLGDGRNVEQVERVAAGLRQGMDFVGYDTPNYPTLRSECVELRITASQEQLRSLLQESDVVLSAMRSAGWNNIVAEGMACGCVPVSTPAGVGDLVIDGQTGVLCAEGSLVSSMTEALAGLNSSPADLKRMRENAINHVQQFSWDAAVPKLVEAVEKWRSDGSTDSH